MNLSRYFHLLVAGLVLCLGWASGAQAAIPATERQVLLDKLSYPRQSRGFISVSP